MLAMDAVKLVTLALKVISDRLLMIAALGLNFTLACWIMSSPSLERLGAMLFFAIFSYLLIVKGNSNVLQKPKETE